jgi:transposase
MEANFGFHFSFSGNTNKVIQPTTKGDFTMKSENKIFNLYTDYTQLTKNKPQLRLEISDSLPVDDPVILHQQVCSQMDFSVLENTYSKLGDKPDIPPSLMFTIVSFAYSLGVFSTRQMESAFTNDRRCIWLLGNHKAPDHSTISRFKSRHLVDGVMENLLEQLVKFYQKIGEVRFSDMFIDGTKFEANANPYSFVWMRAVKGNRLKMYEKIKIHLPFFEDRYGLAYEFEAHNALELLRNLHNLISEMAKSQKIIFVYGSGKRKSLIQRDLEKLTEWIKRERDYQIKEDTAKGRNSFSKTDTDATFMVMKKDHMRNEQLRPGYNIQAGVEGEYILHVQVFQDSTDMRTMIPFLKSFDDSYHQKPDLCLDAGYESEENYEYLKSAGYYSYIKPANYEQSKKRKFKKNIGKRENMDYDPQADEYTCAMGKKLKVTGRKNEKTKTGYIREVTIYESEGCQNCPLRKECTKARPENNKRLQVSKKFIEHREESLGRITSEEGIKMRINRSIQSEGAFGWIKANYGFKRFLMRGQPKVSVEVQLLAFALNVKKLHNKIQNGRTGKTIHEVKIACEK